MKLNFIWHMHQPDYRAKNGIMQMPWVFLHAIKDYYDMPWILSLHQNAKATFNITPTLMEQLQLYYENPQKWDKFLALWIKEPSELDEKEKDWLIKICKTSQFKTMVKPFKRYKELYVKGEFSDSELRDLETVFILSWCGNYLRQKNSVVKQLIQKERAYTQEDKKLLFQTLSLFIATIFDFYRELYLKGQISIWTTPYYHPILPLLIDMQNAKRANPSTNIPENYISLQDDAKEHIDRAKKSFYNLFGFEAKGFWPAEGAVDVKSAELFKNSGIEFIATDEAILYKSLQKNEKSLIYNIYNYNGVNILFRDHYLSDLIGFEYKYKSAEDASEHFVKQLENIEKSDSQSVVSVILDGENAWEFYPNNGFDFLNKLYAKLEALPWCELTRVDNIAKTGEKLDYLAPGSWINGTFDTWVGEKQKSKAWELLFLTKRFYLQYKDELSDEVKNSIENIFLKAESSDWYWWFGSDHYTEYAQEFDKLFREHLIDIFDLMQKPAPSELFLPIIENRSFADFWIRPKSFISPLIDGKKDSFFEWLDAGSIDESKLFSTMSKSDLPVKKILYGEDKEKLYFSFEGDFGKLCKNGMIKVVIEPVNKKFTLALNEGKVQKDGIDIEIYCDSILELSLVKADLNAKKIFIRFELSKEDKIIQVLPSFGELEIILNDDYSRNWYI